jgi:class 3 adenylate cyclase
MMNDKMNKTSISSIVALDVIDYSKKSEAEQMQLKQLLMQLVQHAVLDIPQSDRVIMESSSGAAIACGGPLEDALEDALFISITIRDEILKHNSQSTLPIYAQFGINLGSVSAVGSNIVGEGIDEAQRIKRFANPNQILVSNVYFEMASKLTQEISQMFEKYEMHAHDHDVYAVRVLKER